LSPILVRPVREQLEHDRVIRLLQQDLQKRKVEVGINPGAEQNAAVGAGSRKEYPDAVVYSLDEKGKKVVGVVEVETSESVNHLEAMAQWAHLAKLRVPFHLYVPMNSIDVARRLSNDYKIAITEIWSYHQVGDQFRFTLIHPASSSRGGRGSTSAPRTVSVASIRVALPPEPELAGPEEPPVQPAGATPGPAPSPPGKAAALKTIPARAVAPAAGQAKTAKGPMGSRPRVVPVKTVSPAPTKPVASRTVPQKQSAVKPASGRPAAAKPLSVRSAAAASVAKSRVTSKASLARPLTKPAKATATPGGKVTAWTLPPKSAKGRPQAKVTAGRSPAKAARLAKPAARSAAKPASKRK
jgi:hypothetical protein